MILSSLGAISGPCSPGPASSASLSASARETLVKDLISGLFFLLDDASGSANTSKSGGLGVNVERINVALAVAAHAARRKFIQSPSAGSTWWRTTAATGRS